MITDLYVCICGKEYDDKGVYDFHWEICESANRSVHQDILDGKDVSLEDCLGDLKLEMYGCPDCSPTAFYEAIEAAAKYMVNETDENKKVYDDILARFAAHVDSHQNRSLA